MTFVTVALVVGILTKTLLMFHNTPTTISQLQASNKEESYIKDVTVDSKNADNNNTDKDLNSLFDVENSSDNFQSNNGNTNKQEATSSNLEKLSNSNNTNKQETISCNLEKSGNNDTNGQETISLDLEKSSNSNNTNKQTVTNSQLKDANSNVNTENKGSTNATLEVKTPTIRYDRTTSIYANDNITLLRIEYYTNNKLTYYSVIEQFDATTKSYIEKIYRCNRETNIDPLIRTDVYTNGQLVKSY